MMDRATDRPTIAVGVTGASGAIYAVRTIAALLEAGCHLEIVFSDYGRRLLADELGPDAKVDRLIDWLAERYGDGVRRGSSVIFSNKDMGATIASGSHQCQGMVVVPCSMKTLAGVAHGLSRSLIERAADVMLKERRRLVLVPRETPMSLPELKNMVAAAEAGAMILPAMPGFYQQPKTIDDLASFVAGKILNALGFEQHLFPPWQG
jgi:4-hydroxy-3-polyprenylbenzoate decarboxylase